MFCVCVGGGGGGGGGCRLYQADFRLTSEGSLMEHWPHFLEFPFHFLKIVVGMQAFSSHYSVVSGCYFPDLWLSQFQNRP